MNIYKITFFLLIMQGIITMISATDAIPTSCPDNTYTDCTYWSGQTSEYSAYQAELEGKVKSGQFQTSSSLLDLASQFFQTTSYAIGNFVNLATMVLSGYIPIISMALGYTTMGNAIAVFVQVIVYFFYMIAIISFLKEIQGEV